MDCLGRINIKEKKRVDIHNPRVFICFVLLVRSNLTSFRLPRFYQIIYHVGRKENERANERTQEEKKKTEKVRRDSIRPKNHEGPWPEPTNHPSPTYRFLPCEGPDWLGRIMHALLLVHGGWLAGHATTSPSHS